MEAFFDAQSVAVIGVSNSLTNLGQAMVYNLMEFRYQGIIYLVGPKGGVFLGHKIHPNVLELPESVDLAAVLVPAAAVPDVLRQCGQKGIRRIVLESAGFRELGQDRLVLEQEVAEVLERYGMRMIGPNCIGIMNRGNGLAVPFMPMKADAPPGRIGVISQSGGVGAMILNMLAAENIGFSKFASVGNKLNVNESELIRYLIRNDSETEMVFVYLEGIADGRSLMQNGFESDKPIVLHKSNRGKSGAVIARSHSAALSSDDDVVSAALKQCGIIRAQEQQEALEVLKAMSLPPMKGKRLAIISRSGGHAVMAADAAEEYGFELPPFPPDLLRTVKERSRAGVIQLHNPMDLGDLFDLELYRMLVQQTLARDDIDGLLFIHNFQGIFDAEPSRVLIKRLEEVMRNAGKPLSVCIFTRQAELDRNKRAVTYPVFADPREAVRALACNRDYFSPEMQPIPLASVRPEGVDRNRAAEILRDLPKGPVPAEILANILTAYGIPLVPWSVVDSVEKAVAEATRIGFPVALKTAQLKVVHKSDEGGVWLNLDGEEAVREAYAGLSGLGARALVQKMVVPQCEWLVGGRQDAQFGPVLVSGLGGIYVEVFKETAIRIGPLQEEEVERLLTDVQGSSLLDGFRGRPVLDRQALRDTIVRVSWLLADHPCLVELDMNPVGVFEEGCYALDWRATKGAL